MSTASRRGCRLRGFVNVGQDGVAFALESGENAESFGESGPAISGEAAAIGLIERRLENEWSGDAPDRVRP